MEIDNARWRALRDALRDAEEALPQIIVLQQAQSALARARDDLDRHRSRGPTGRADQHTSVEAVQKAFARDIAELERRVVEHEGEVKRIDARIKSAGAKRQVLQQLVEGCRQWARQQGIVLPGDDDARVVPPPGLPGPTSTHIVGAPPGARDFLWRPA